ncbi:hypothetical protein, partial [Klebsiella quasipneumoniae]|uniref:hypothetical protein n=1 Tax=Klebsiella quasipneumoniae TaxID=1463165 RepID=UPI001955983E
EKRIKLSLGAMSPVKYRQHLGITTSQSRKTSAAQSGHYDFATTTFVKAQLKCPLSSSIKMTTLISHSLY